MTLGRCCCIADPEGRPAIVGPLMPRFVTGLHTKETGDLVESTVDGWCPLCGALVPIHTGEPDEPMIPVGVGA